MFLKCISKKQFLQIVFFFVFILHGLLFQTNQIFSEEQKKENKDEKSFLPAFIDTFIDEWTGRDDFEKNIYIGGAISWTFSHERAYMLDGDYYDPNSFVPSLYFGIGKKLNSYFYLGADFTVDFVTFRYQNSSLNRSMPTILENVFAFRIILGLNPNKSRIMPYIGLGVASGNSSIDVNGKYFSKQIAGIHGALGLNFLVNKHISFKVELAYNYFIFYDNQISKVNFPNKKLQYIDVVSLKVGVTYKF